MTKRSFLLVSVLPIVVLLAVAGHVWKIAAVQPQGADKGFAVVELFTSEGCSSCPPADRVLAKIASEYKNNVYVLGYHVDYWDRLGWRDIYSNADYTRRQQEYARVFRLGSIYTPEAVVNGEKELVGSDEARLRADIDQDLKRPANGKIALHPVSDGRNIKVDYTLTDAGDGVLQVALVQKHAETQVGAGENGGRKLEHINIVRELKTAPAGNSGSLDFSIPRGLQAKDCLLIAFVQGKDLVLRAAAGAELP